MTRRVTLATLTLVLLAFGVLVAPFANATFPGKNGRLVAPNVAGDRIVTMKVDGTDVDPITSKFPDFVEAPQVSANGKWVVFDGGGANTDLFKVRIDGSDQQRLTNGDLYEWSPSWAPDGKHIVYAKDGGGSQIMMMKSDGTGKHSVGSAQGEYPRVSPNGKKIAYGASGGQIHIIKVDGSNDHAVTTGGGDYPDWAPNGTHLIYERGAEVWRIDTDGDNESQVSFGKNIELGPVYSPDGDKIFFHAGVNLYVADADSSNVHMVGSSGQCCLGWQPKP